MGAALAAALEAERRRWALWTPALFGAGVALFFALPVEPPLWLGLACAALAAPALLAHRRLGALMAPAVIAACLAGGFGAAVLRATLVAAPVLERPMTATIEGRVRLIDASASGRTRLLLDDLFVYGVAPEATPARARLTLLEGEGAAGLAPGDRVSALARLGPPAPPVEPGGFDFRRAAWFRRIGAIGLARSALAPLPAAPPGGPLERAGLWLDAMRAEIGAALRARLPGDAGAFAAAVAVGDRSGIPAEALEALRDSNLAHLLAISGLHMALVCGFVFSAARIALALTPGAALRLPIKKIAACVALAAGLGYLALSGAGTPTRRAFVMAAAALGAVLCDRPAVTLRALAAAGFAVLIAAPESLGAVGFQMSFAATLALVAAYDFARRRGWLAPAEGLGRRLLGYAAALALTSLIAGAATAPFAAHHFNRLTTYGLFANLLAVPALGLWAAPALMAAAVAAPFGLEGPFLRIAAGGVDWILAVARFFADQPGAARAVGAAPPAAFALIALGGLWLCLWRGAALRAGGALAAAAGLALWAAGPERPEALVAPEAALVGVMTEAGRSLDHARAAGYAARVWLRRDGDPAAPEDAAARRLWRREGRWAEAALGEGWRLHRLEGRRADGIEARCAPRTILLAPDLTRAAPAGGCVFLDRDALAATGALAFDPRGDDPGMVSAAEAAGRRLWTGAAAQ